MGKEAKIGLSIIGILAIALVVVLGQRMLGSKDDSKIAKDAKKTTQKKEGGDKPGDLNKPKFDLFKPKDKKSPSDDGSKKVTPALAVSQRLQGTSGASDKSMGAWPLTNGKPSPGSSLMPKPASSTALESHQEKGGLGARTAGLDNKPYSLGVSNAYSQGYASPGGSPAKDPTPGVAVLSSPPHRAPSPYRSQPTQGALSDPQPSNAGSGYASSRSGGYGNAYDSTGAYGSRHASGAPQPSGRSYAASDGYPSPSSDSYGSSSYETSNYRSSDGYHRAPVGPRTGGARLDSPPSRYASDSSYDRDSRYKSSSYASSSYDSSSYGSSYSSGSGSNYGGGPQPDGSYIVKPHQNYWAISKDVYGTGAYFKALAEANRSSIPDENRLKVGDRVKTPDLAKLEQSYPELCPAPERRDIMRKRAEMASSSPRYGGSEHQYIVQSGDTLYDIARFELGDAARWTEIYEINRQVLQDSFDYLTPGLKLAMPSKDGKASAPASGYDSPSKYGESRSRYETETPRTAARSNYYGSSSATSPPPSSGYDRSSYSSPGYGSSSSSSSYDGSQYQPSRSTYPR